MTTVGISYFWFLGALLQMALPLFGQHALHVGDAEISWLLTALAVGIGAGSLVAGRLSGDKVELGLVPIGSIGMGVSVCCSRPRRRRSRSLESRSS